MQHNTALNRIASNVKQLGDQLKMENSSAELFALAIQLEGYSKIVHAYAMEAAENKK